VPSNVLLAYAFLDFIKVLKAAKKQNEKNE
jgi:hypothetical protein